MAGSNVCGSIVVDFNLYDKVYTVWQPQEEGKGRGKEVQCQDVCGIIADILHTSGVAQPVQYDMEYNSVLALRSDAVDVPYNGDNAQGLEEG